MGHKQIIELHKYWVVYINKLTSTMCYRGNGQKLNKVKLTPKTKNKCYFIWWIEKVAVSLYQQKGNKNI